MAVSESTWKKVFKVVEDARTRMKPNVQQEVIKCPICGKHTAYIKRANEYNHGDHYSAACSRGCFSIKE
ncbi:MAG: hypothetical protein M0P69_19580 [Bacteroidales bacterium]|nr:hypothetical protein [Bacteroidales bacterium]